MTLLCYYVPVIKTAPSVFVCVSVCESYIVHLQSALCTMVRVTTSLKKFLKSLNFTQVLEILEKSLNFNGNFGRSLKSPWILKMILEILEFRGQWFTAHFFFQIGAATRHTSMLSSTSLQFLFDKWLDSFVIFFFGGTL